MPSAPAWLQTALPRPPPLRPWVLGFSTLNPKPCWHQTPAPPTPVANLHSLRDAPPPSCPIRKAAHQPLFTHANSGAARLSRTCGRLEFQPQAAAPAAAPAGAAVAGRQRRVGDSRGKLIRPPYVLLCTKKDPSAKMQQVSLSNTASDCNFRGSEGIFPFATAARASLAAVSLVTPPHRQRHREPVVVTRVQRGVTRGRRVTRDDGAGDGQGVTR